MSGATTVMASPSPCSARTSKRTRPSSVRMKGSTVSAAKKGGAAYFQ
jgi:hypothetical protein